MNQNEIMAMAREAGGYESPQYPENLVMDEHDLGRFAAMVEAKERDACAHVCESEWSNVAERMYGHECAASIRARGKP